ncbi:MAG TPA: bifunctional UDP-N-acetylglucosamine diphosphorylase/glucosamine-1-phosphate N-acetyltransferase GlmU [Bacillota bacterium]|nr:bifunctional UDP-N-acetylglucosamine diphosphorylase/glucosamine-1-phosphate N-acetyltransferase GlmU [Bacillota bacterium]HOH10536.1 bifunctional UDP-N-acetylglucosamine diphosphorylase/glucosamine-1-phosphate N-acetyltransferase GlmU [Bacillota bacterium]HPM64022.1 bifunctional UDP-N-acetylglucosamine diphosphorylase/glucosamine-1-phosphate N-acetyltransferase GlmU [Bacillota bacterium]HQJ24220.1 bifunctional UDP-N-acetylglucosamine diphosphorylase/glucosamine-1-phosphate N-acetyltransferas
MPFAGLILAAGMSKRMKTETPKVLHKVCGLPIIDHVISNLQKAGCERIATVVGHMGELVSEHISNRSEIFWQHERLGTAHAVMQAKGLLDTYGRTILVIPGDVPAVRPETISCMVAEHEAGGAAATVLTMELDDPAAYGRIVRDAFGDFTAIVEFKDASDEIRQIKEVSTGIIAFDPAKLKDALQYIGNENAQGEYYLTDALMILYEAGHGIQAVLLDDSDEGVGINSRQDLATAQAVLKVRKLDEVMSSGVTVESPETTFIDFDVVIGQDTVIHPYTILTGRTVVGRRCEIGPHTTLLSAQVDDDSDVCHSYARECIIGPFCKVGPYAYIRPGTELKQGAKAGSFVEIKNSVIGEGSKVPHLSYIGDADVGSGVNIGCGTVVCNYDGFRKYRTVIEDDAFVGSNTNLVAPVKVGKGSYIATGSTITADVPEGALAVARARQENKEGWAERKRRLAKADKDN